MPERATNNGDTPNPSAVGWANLALPGAGASLRGEPVRGLVEATTELGFYYGGTFFGNQRHFSIDGSVNVPTGRNIVRPLFGQWLQEIGLKLHMYDVFYNYQQAALLPGNASLEATYAQPLYKGEWDDVLLAPFKPKNLSSIWTWGPILLGAGFLYYSYKTDTDQQSPHQSSNAEDALYGLANGITVPIGSSFGEEVLFRGFMMREFRQWTNSIPLAIAGETVAFASLHTPHLRPFALVGGVFYGINVNHFDGGLEPAIASHFWIDCISGIFDYFTYRKVEGRRVPLSISVPFQF